MITRTNIQNLVVIPSSRRSLAYLGTFNRIGKMLRYNEHTEPYA